MTVKAPKYDVAISFLSQDEPTAAALHDRLSEGLEVFFYPRNQEELAGTDGMESMRMPFLEESRIAVVLYREPWGKTPWTGVEQTAIQESCLKQGWKKLFFIVLDNTNTLPVWLPDNHIRFNYTDFGLEQAVGAIKARVQESGGAVTPLTALKRAELYEQDVLYIADKKQISTYEGMAIVREKVLELFAAIQKLCGEIRSNGTSIRVGSNQGRCVLTNNVVSLAVGWIQPVINSTDRCALKVVEYNGQMALPDEQVMFFSERTVLSETNFIPDLSRAREYGWTKQNKPSEFLSSAVLANKCVIQFLDLAARANRGEIEPCFL